MSPLWAVAMSSTSPRACTGGRPRSPRSTFRSQSSSSAVRRPDGSELEVEGSPLGAAVVVVVALVVVVPAPDGPAVPGLVVVVVPAGQTGRPAPAGSQARACGVPPGASATDATIEATASTPRTPARTTPTRPPFPCIA